ncbi:MAG: glycosyltransferase family 2 protein [Betaproteobacteria bacterium]
MTAPQISIVTISYNQGRFLGECVESVLSQGLAKLEYIAVDPGSIDGSRELLAARGNRIDHRVFEPDNGPADGLNKGFALATGDVFGYINADDRLVAGALDYVQRYFSSHPDVDVLCGAIHMVDEGGRHALRGRTADRFDLARYAAGICTVGQQATFFRRGAFERAGGFNIENRISWDGELLVDLALSGARFATSRRALGEFRIYPQSITGSNRHRDMALREHARMAQKIAAHGIPVFSSREARWRRLAYKLDPARHLGYLLTG